MLDSTQLDTHRLGRTTLDERSARCRGPSYCNNTYKNTGENIHVPGGVFLFSCSLFVLYPHLFLRLDCPAFCLLSLLDKRQNTNIHARREDFFVFSFTVLVLRPYLFFVLIFLHFAFLSLFTTNNTNIHDPGGIRMRNPRKRSAADPRIRPLGHCDQHKENSAHKT